MKNKLTWVLFLSFFLIFVILCLIFYFKYLNNFINLGSGENVQNSENNEAKIFLSQDNNLYTLSPNQNSALNDKSLQRIQSNGKVLKGEISSNNQIIVYEVKNNLDFSEIWQVELKSNNSQIIATRGQENLNADLDYFNPKINHSGTKIAFIGHSSTDSETIYFKDLSDGAYSELLIQPNNKISDYTWSNDDKKIVYCLSVNADCWIQKVDGTNASNILNMEISQIVSTENGYIFIGLKNNAHNIYSSNLEGKNIAPLSDLESPKNVSSFKYNPKSENIVYEVKENDISNIYSVKLNGSNRIQLTFDGVSSNPLISPSGDKFAFLKAFDGIYLSGISNNNPIKISNSYQNVNLLFW